LRRSGVEGVKGVQAIVRQAKGKTPRKASALEKTGFFSQLCTSYRFFCVNLQQ
jgi:hypothetical protein